MRTIKYLARDYTLTLNIKKTNYMMFHRTRANHKLRNITICGMNVTCTKTPNWCNY